MAGGFSGHHAKPEKMGRSEKDMSTLLPTLSSYMISSNKRADEE
jgi:hypothetical protein